MSKNVMLNAENIAHATDYLRQKFPSILAIIGFGSRFSECHRPDSDLDLAILVAGYAAPEIIWQARSDLAEIFQCDVDLLDLRASSVIIQYQIITTGTILWQKPLEAGLYICAILSQKMDFDLVRAPFIERIKKSGKIYGE